MVNNRFNVLEGVTTDGTTDGTMVWIVTDHIVSLHRFGNAEITVIRTSDGRCIDVKGAPEKVLAALKALHTS